MHRPMMVSMVYAVFGNVHRDQTAHGDKQDDHRKGEE